MGFSGRLHLWAWVSVFARPTVFSARQLTVTRQHGRTCRLHVANLVFNVLWFHSFPNFRFSAYIANTFPFKAIYLHLDTYLKNTGTHFYVSWSCLHIMYRRTKAPGIDSEKNIRGPSVRTNAKMRNSRIRSASRDRPSRISLSLKTILPCK